MNSELAKEFGRKIEVILHSKVINSDVRVAGGKGAEGTASPLSRESNIFPAIAKFFWAGNSSQKLKKIFLNLRQNRIHFVQRGDMSIIQFFNNYWVGKSNFEKFLFIVFCKARWADFRPMSKYCSGKDGSAPLENANGHKWYQYTSLLLQFRNSLQADSDNSRNK